VFCGGCGNKIGGNATYCPNCGWTASGKKPQNEKKDEDSSFGEIIGGAIAVIVVILILRSCVGC